MNFTRLAEQDIDGIIHFIAQDNPNQALKFVDELQKRAVQTLEVFDFSTVIRQVSAETDYTVYTEFWLLR